jgi:hypothetical protein
VGNCFDKKRLLTNIESAPSPMCWNSKVAFGESSDSRLRAIWNRWRWVLGFRRWHAIQTKYMQRRDTLRHVADDARLLFEVGEQGFKRFAPPDIRHIPFLVVQSEQDKNAVSAVASSQVLFNYLSLEGVTKG